MNLIELQTEIDALAKRTVTRKDQFIRRAEQRIVRAFATDGLQQKMVQRKTVTASAMFSLPSGLRSIEVMYIDSNPKKELRFMPPAAFFARWLSSETSRPKAYTVQGSTVTLGPAPDDPYDIEVWYRKALNIQKQADILIPFQTHLDYDNVPPNGFFGGGTGHAVGDVIFLGQTEVYVLAEAGGAVTEFEIRNADRTQTIELGQKLDQTDSSGTGTGFSLDVDANNLSNAILIDYPELYIYATMIEHYMDVRNKAEMSDYMTMFKDAISDLEDEAFNMGGALQPQIQQAGAGAPRIASGRRGG